MDENAQAYEKFFATGYEKGRAEAMVQTVMLVKVLLEVHGQRSWSSSLEEPFLPKAVAAELRKAVESFAEERFHAGEKYGREREKAKAERLRMKAEADAAAMEASAGVLAER